MRLDCMLSAKSNNARGIAREARARIKNAMRMERKR